MAKKILTLVVQENDIKIRKTFAPKTKVVASKKVYSRKREKKGGPDDGYHLFLFLSQKAT